MTNTHQNIDLNRLKEVIRITELARTLGLDIKGRQARCYNSAGHKHGDRNFSLGLDVRRNSYKCFACGEGGSVIDLYMAVRRVELPEAIKDLTSMAGLTPQNATKSYETSPIQQNPPYTTYEPKKPASEPVGAYRDIYEELYFACGGLDKESKDYLMGATRGLTEDTLNKFLLFSVSDYQKADQHLKARFSKDDLQKSGVIGEKGNLIFWKHKIIIPFLSGGRVVYLRGRYFFKGDAKTDGSKMLGLVGKTTKRLFNADKLADLEKGSKVYICEGEFDAMALEQRGYNAVGILGVTNFSPEMTGLFKGLDVVLSLDNDEAGEQATAKIAEMFLLNGQAVKSKQLPEGVKDVSEYFLKTI